MIVLYLLLIFTLSVLAQDCNPLYQRLFYDPSPAPELKVDMVVMFNTLSPCPDAYVSVQYRNSKDEFPCKADLVSIDGPQVPYLQHYVHNCQIEIDSASPVSEFTYSIRPASKVTHAIELASVSLQICSPPFPSASSSLPTPTCSTKAPTSLLLKPLGAYSAEERRR